MAKRYWLMKCEPDAYTIEDLERDGTTSWEGVRNYQARNFMRDDMKVGDQVFIYHSSCAEPGIVGTAEVVSEATPDDSALDPKSEYYDEKSAKDGRSRWCVVEVAARERFEGPVTLARLKETKGLEAMLVVRRGQRLSIQPVTAEEWKIVRKLGKLAPV